MTTAGSATLNFQGIPVNAEGVNPDLFFRLTRRKRAPEIVRAYAGIGNVDNLNIRKSDILSVIRIRFSGSLVTTTATGAVVSTSLWPYGLAKNVKLTANGQTNLIDCSGVHLKAREFMCNTDLNDRGVVRTVVAASVSQGTLSKNSENWGVAQNGTVAAGTFPVELEWVVPVAEDEKDLSGAIFCQTSSMDITLNVQWANLVDLFTITGTSTATLTGNVIVETEKFSIPVSGGIMIVPDLSLFHSIVQTSYTSVSTGENQVRLIGQGAGKQLLRLWFRTLNGSPVPAPLAVNATNYGIQSWMYGTNERPESYQDGQSLRLNNEWTYGNDMAAIWGLAAHEFAISNAFRDTVDMGQTSELRLAVTVQSGVTLNSPTLEYVQETVFSAGS